MRLVSCLGAGFAARRVHHSPHGGPRLLTAGLARPRVSAPVAPGPNMHSSKVVRRGEHAFIEGCAHGCLAGLLLLLQKKKKRTRISRRFLVGAGGAF